MVRSPRLGSTVDRFPGASARYDRVRAQPCLGTASGVQGSGAQARRPQTRRPQTSTRSAVPAKVNLRARPAPEVRGGPSSPSRCVRVHRSAYLPACLKVSPMRRRVPSCETQQPRPRHPKAGLCLEPRMAPACTDPLESADRAVHRSRQPMLKRSRLPNPRTQRSNSTRLTTMPVKMLQTVPIISVTAKPLIGPVPY